MNRNLTWLTDQAPSPGRERPHLETATTAHGPLIASWLPDARALAMATGPWLGWPVDPEELVAPSQWQVDVLVCGDDVVATGARRRVDDHTVRLGRLLVDPARRGRGWGRTLVTELVRACAEDPAIRQVELGVFDDNAPARHLYSVLGFTETGEVRHHDVGGQRWTAVQMRLDLPTSRRDQPR